MLLNINELPKGKSLQYNVFNGNKIYSYDEGMNVIIMTELCTKFDNQFAIDGKTLDVIKSLNNPDILFQDDKLQVKQGKMKYTSKTYNKDIPTLNLDDMNECEIDIEELEKARKFTSFVDTRPILTSVCIKPNGNIYASDSYVAFRHYEGYCEEKGINIPNIFIDLLKGAKGTIKLKFNDNLVVFVLNNITYIGRLITGDFPKIDKIMQNYGNLVEFNRDELSNAIKFAKNVGIDKETSNIAVCNLKNDLFTSKGENEFETELVVKHDVDYEVNLAIDKLELLLSVSNDGESFNVYVDNGLRPISISQNKDIMLVTPIRGN